jgi:cytochrome P450
MTTQHEEPVDGTSARDPVRHTDRNDLAAFNPFDPATLQCPHPRYAEMRSAAPVNHIPDLDLYLVTRHDLVGQVIRDPATYSSSFPSKFGKATVRLSEEELSALASVQREGYPRVPTMISADPPAHTRYRRLVSKAFSAKAINALEPVARAITARLIDGWPDRGAVEFVSQFAVPLPMEVIATALNVPDDRLDDFKRWSDDVALGLGAAPTLERRLEAEHGINEFQRYFAEALELRRADPQDDILTNLVNAKIDGDADEPLADQRPLDLTEMLSILQQLLTGGNETTTKLLAEMARLLGEHREHWQRVQRDPSVIPAIVEETLRLASPAQGMWRVTTCDTQLGDVNIPKGSRVIVVYGSANRDERVFPNPDSFDPQRANLGDHLAFGKGTHYCLGANLSRLEARVAFEELAKRVSSFSLLDTNSYRYNPSFMLRGLVMLDIDVLKNTTAPDGNTVHAS